VRQINNINHLVSFLTCVLNCLCFPPKTTTVPSLYITYHNDDEMKNRENIPSTISSHHHLKMVRACPLLDKGGLDDSINFHSFSPYISHIYSSQLFPPSLIFYQVITPEIIIKQHIILKSIATKKNKLIFENIAIRLPSPKNTV